MNSAEKLAFLRIARTSGVGPVAYKKLRRASSSHAEIIKFWKDLPCSKLLLPTEDAALREMDNLAKNGGNMLFLGDEDYPSFLAELPDAPLVLSVLGDEKALHLQQVAIVGTRGASGAAVTWTRSLAETLGRAGIAISSGLARGIDTAAHEGALDANAPTLAVVAGGVDHIYPPENKALRERIIAHGAVVSEQPWGMVPQATFFPRRNRIIAGLSVGTVVSEATRYSGSLITAECALEYGRDVYAVPGSPMDARAGGPNWLLKNGAILVENAEDILAQLPRSPAPYVPPVRRVNEAAPSLFDPLPAAPLEVGEEEVLEVDLGPRAKVFSLLGPVGIEVDDLARMSGLDGVSLSSLLVELELEGLAFRDVDGGWKRC